MKALLVIAPRNFRDEEYSETKRALEEAGIKVKTASLERECTGMFGTRVSADLMLREARSEDFDAMVLIGGSGALVYKEDAELHELLKKFESEGKVIGAICIAPTVLARAGILRGKKATVWTSAFDKSGAREIKSYGASYLPQPVVRDGKIITADGPTSAAQFGKEIARALGE
jgi:protease I